MHKHTGLLPHNLKTDLKTTPRPNDDPFLDQASNLPDNYLREHSNRVAKKQKIKNIVLNS